MPTLLEPTETTQDAFDPTPDEIAAEQFLLGGTVKDATESLREKNAAESDRRQRCSPKAAKKITAALARAKAEADKAAELTAQMRVSEMALFPLDKPATKSAWQRLCGWTVRRKSKSLVRLLILGAKEWAETPMSEH